MKENQPRYIQTESGKPKDTIGGVGKAILAYLLIGAGAGIGAGLGFVGGLPFVEDSIDDGIYDDGDALRAGAPLIGLLAGAGLGLGVGGYLAADNYEKTTGNRVNKSMYALTSIPTLGLFNAYTADVFKK